MDQSLIRAAYYVASVAHWVFVLTLVFGHVFATARWQLEALLVIAVITLVSRVCCGSCPLTWIEMWLLRQLDDGPDEPDLRDMCGAGPFADAISGFAAATGLPATEEAYQVAVNVLIAMLIARLVFRLQGKQ